MSARVHLKIAIAEHPHTSAIRNGSIPIEGVDAEFITVQLQIGAFRRKVRDVEFDVCELAPTTYIIARAYGAPFVALPIFVVRRFHHGGLLVRPDAGITTPKDLEGKKIGVRAYSVTTGVWTRQVLIDEFGLDSSKVTWVIDDEEHVTQPKLPSNVIHAEKGTSLVEMMANGELAAGFGAAAGIGRTGAPTGGWKEVEADSPDLLPNAAELEAEYFARAGVYPMHGTIVVKDPVLAEHPWVAKAIYDAFAKAKADWLVKLESGEADTPGDRKYRALRKVVGPDPLPYGLKENRKTIETLETTASKQGLTPRRMSINELFVDPQASDMIVDCHGHFTTVPASFRDWRAKQVLAATDLAGAPPLSGAQVSDDQIREAIGNGQLKLQKERGSDMTLSSPIAAAIHDRFVAAVVERMKSLKVGDARKAGTDIGPVVDERQLRRISSTSRSARARARRSPPAARRSPATRTAYRATTWRPRCSPIRHRACASTARRSSARWSACSACATTTRRWRSPTTRRSASRRASPRPASSTRRTSSATRRPA